MPEGDTIFRAAARIRPLLAGKELEAATGHERWIDPGSFVGQKIDRVEARGKHLLIHFGDGRAIHSHLGMDGAWHVYREGEPWHKPERNAALVLRADGAVCVCFTPKTLQILSRDGLRRHEHLRLLGPDLLGPEFDAGEALRRLRMNDELPIGEAVMNQRLVAGIGNIYKSETLFLSKVDPFAPVSSLSDEQWLKLLALARKLMRRNLTTQTRTIRLGRDSGRMHVYGRPGSPCFTCGTIILVRRQGDQGRTTFWCPSCQPPAVSNS